MLTTVTITGADDAVDPGELVKLSGEFPFVEWGILMSASRAGTPRYPTRRWMIGLENLAKQVTRTNDPKVKPMRLSAHFCGQVAREALSGRLHDLPVIERVQRIQVNGYTPPSPGVVAFAKRMPGYEIILQVRSEDEMQSAMSDVVDAGRCSMLFDASGGRGLRRPERWPTRWTGWMGFAGGIDPDNAQNSVLAIMGSHVGDFWIDMESGVRTGDRFDLKLVREVLEKCAPLVQR